MRDQGSDDDQRRDALLLRLLKTQVTQAAADLFKVGVSSADMLPGPL
jgi:hypothetical protein